MPFKAVTRSTAVDVTLSSEAVAVTRPTASSVGPAVATSGGHRLDRGSRRELRLDDGSHARCERDADVDLGEAVVAAVDPHDPKVVGNSEHRAGAERVTVDGGDRGDRSDEYTSE